MSRIRIEGLLAAFPKLIGTGKQHTYVETENVRYVYQPIEALYLLLVTNKQSNILEDLDTLRLLSKLVYFLWCFKFTVLCSQIHLFSTAWSFHLVTSIIGFVTNLVWLAGLNLELLCAVSTRFSVIWCFYGVLMGVYVQHLHLNMALVHWFLYECWMKWSVVQVILAFINQF